MIKLKRKTAKEILAESFREVAENKNVDKITIQDIVDNCGYSPATFYRNFHDKYDLIAWDYTRVVAKIMGRIGDNYTWKQTLIDGANWFCTEKEHLINLFRHTSGHDSFIMYMTKINCDALKKHILLSDRKKELTETEELLTRVYCLGTVNLTCEWLLGMHKASPDEIADIYEKSVPTPLRKYLS
ncbi:MAG: TetR/AcrR family transcriptional regulator C-terminal domain-containing protein [Clostridia bacterium]|nr:TetR/AcrR family transcriptional regulator C-terminal domain-containing protein [Clostridia bacterium]